MTGTHTCMVQAANCAMCDGSPCDEPAPRRTTCFLLLPNPPWVLDTRHQFNLGAIVWILNCIPHGQWVLCSTTSLSNLNTQGKAEFPQWKEEALQPCFSNMFSYHEGWAFLCLAQQPAADTMGKNVEQHLEFVVIVPWFTLSKNLWIYSLYWLEKKWEGGAACRPCQLVSFSCKKCWAGWEICSVITGALDRQNRITLILGFCLFPVH